MKNIMQNMYNEMMHKCLNEYTGKHHYEMFFLKNQRIYFK